jgi:GAF domain-containing protein
VIAEKLRHYLDGLASQAGDGSPGELRDALDGFLRIVEAELEPDVRASILLLNETGDRLVLGAAPSLHAAYGAAISEVAINSAAASREAAGRAEHAIEVTDLTNDPRWTNFGGLVAQHGLRACWSSPIAAVDGEMAGVFALYHRTLRRPTPTEVGAIGLITRAASRLIERYKAKKAAKT